MNEEEKKSFLRTYHHEPEEAKQLIQIYDTMNKSNIPNNNSKTNTIISKVIETHSQRVVPASAPTTLGNSPNQLMQQPANPIDQLANPIDQLANSQLSFGGKPKPKSKAKSSTKKSKSKSKAKSSTKKPKGRK
jgi:hypothetical protein